jgi:porphobilinogen deaminase
VTDNRPIIIATRGSALALAQSHLVLDRCRRAFPRLRFELKIIKTTGDKLQRASLAKKGESLPKGLFTKELEVALLKQQADLAVHSLKDLPTELPAGLRLGAVSQRADVRDVLVYRDAAYLAQVATQDAQLTEWTPGQSERRGFAPKFGLEDLPAGAVVATSSERRKAQLLALRPDVKAVEIRGNVPTRLTKLAERSEFDALLLAAAGLERLNFRITAEGRLLGDAVPDGLLATPLAVETLLPCVGQAAIGIEIRETDERVATICGRLDHFNTHQCVLAERAFLRAMGGGCQSPVAAYAEVQGDKLWVRAVSFRSGPARRAEGKAGLNEAVQLGERLAAELAGE